MGLDGAHRHSTQSSFGWHLLFLGACCLPGALIHLIYTRDQPDSDSLVKWRRLPGATQ